jgi:hypothetical protein
MGSFKERRQLARFRVRWPMLYANEELIGQASKFFSPQAKRT